MQLALRLIINAFAIWLAAYLVGAIEVVSPEDEIGWKIIVLLAVAAVFTLVNALVKPIVQVLSLPLVIVTLGLFLLVVNALMLMLTAAITEVTDYGLRVDGFWAALVGALIISIVNWGLGLLVGED
ncbi:phage holin family protein [Nocardia jiangsuensis]|uniref:Phage holin family protein n=1 Tax=Nocardia jiangsuensis TaxID=1691563 RepID=A0ABV8DU49_9NOCA